MKKMLSLLLAAIMLMSLLSACGGSSDPAKANPDAPPDRVQGGQRYLRPVRRL